MATCVRCDANNRLTRRLPSLSLTHDPNVVRQVSGTAIPMPVHVPQSYRQSKFGVESEVTYNGTDAEILTLMGQAVTALHLLAAKMNTFQGLMQSTRDVIKGCRNLATDLQEEIELRRGPQG